MKMNHLILALIQVGFVVWEEPLIQVVEKSRFILEVVPA